MYAKKLTEIKSYENVIPGPFLYTSKLHESNLKNMELLI
jgi:hypothetical protein